MIRRLPGFLAFGLTAAAMAQTWSAFGDEPGNLWIALGIAFAGCATSTLLSGGFAAIPKYLGRDLLGVAVVILLLVLAMIGLEIRGGKPTLRGWELLGWSVAAYAFFLGSQRSFLVLLALDAFLLFVGLVPAPSYGTPALFFLQTMALFAVLAYRERTEETGTAQGAWLPLKTGAVGAAILVGLFGLLCLAHPATSIARAEDPGDFLRHPGRLPNWRRPVAPSQPVPPQPGIDGSSMSFQVDLKFGDHAAHSQSRETILMKVRLQGPRGEVLSNEDVPFFLKTGVVTHYDGRAWTAQSAGGRIVRASEWTEGFQVEQRVLLFPMTGRGLFALYPVRSLDLDEAVVDGDGIASRARDYSGRFKYVARSEILRPSAEALDRASGGAPGARYLQVPAKVATDPEFLRICARIEAKKRQHARVQELLECLSAFQYTLAPGFDARSDATLEFLSRRRGYCQHFASATTLVLRHLGIPARIAVGFAGGEWDDASGVVLVRRRHAHSWVEVHFEGIGWVPFDPAGKPAERWYSDPTLARGSSPDTQAIPPVTPEKTPDTPTRPPDSPVKPPDTPVKPPVTPVKPPETPVKPPVTPTNPAEAPAKPSDVPERRPDTMRESTAGFEREWEETYNRPVATGSTRSADGSGAPEGGDWVGGSGVARLAAEVIRDVLLILLAAVFAWVVVRSVLRLRKEKKRNRSDWAPASWGDGEEIEEEAPFRGGAIPSGSARYKLVMIYLKFLRALEKLGVRRKPSQTAREFVGSLGGGAEALTGLFEEARYGGAEPSAHELDDGRKLARALEQELRNRRGGK